MVRFTACACRRRDGCGGLDGLWSGYLIIYQTGLIFLVFGYFEKAGYVDQIVPVSVNDGEMTVLNVQLEK